MEFAEILALIKKVIFLVGGSCILILLYYRYVKPDKNKIGSDEKPQEHSKGGGPLVKPRKYNVSDYDGEDIEPDPSESIEIDENERRMMDREQNDLDDFFSDETPQDRRDRLAQELKDLGYVSRRWDKAKDDTDANADPL